MKKISGAEIFIESLIKEGVEYIFGLPGAVLCDVYDSLYDSPIKFILARHEQGAAHAADGYARASGKVGVCLVTSGPGATNIVTGVATAYMDSIPMVAFTGQVPTTMIGDDAFQEADIVGVTRTITKHNYLVNNVTELSKIIKEAFYVASTGRPGPVLIDLPKDVLSEKSEFKYPSKVEIRGYNPNIHGHPGQIEKILSAIEDSKRPVIYAGGGVILSGASKELLTFAEATHIPVTNTLMGLGGFPGSHKLFLGMLGMHGPFSANMAISHADLIIAVGARFDDRVTGRVDKFATDAKIVHIDIDPSAISKNVRVDIPIVGDAKEVLKELNIKLKEIQKETPDRTEWLEEINGWEKNHPLKYNKKSELIKPQFVVEKLYELTKGRAIVCTDVGQHQMWAAQYFKFDEPRTFLSSGGLGTMGFGLPASIGAKLAQPKKTVINITGDGSFQMNMQELATAVYYGLPVKVAILNNCSYGMVRQWQSLFYKKRYYATDLNGNPDFVKLAESFGAIGLRAVKEQEVEDVIKKALETDKTVVMDFRVDRDEKVYPMVPAGAPIKEMIID
ncbi:MAG: acetolactate synthase, large subunit, biosynthetic type [Candidatus Schekmanbacteria bacterium RBG_16_38_10]|uniref:Acetolactate synthase n=1 Tax=Candidatus Schekmanbacteria bacterium RBG_16_38_10 TaxID=1817879 RepID=A0A1F7RUG8_9BACT|nr:MAG: acetolactate synthase, large subunit, biosynthetic type [Candidatus Schekmanbacteria bacterium RBG_16_38_10]